jgi:hypothetical protein
MDTAPITDLTARLREITDPSERARAATELLRVLGEVQQEVKDIRRGDVLELRKTLKLREIAEVLGVGTARVDQIVKGR